jgi:hypothetical protein
MLNKFWEGLGESLAQQLVGRLISLAVVFWLGGLIAWVTSHGGLHRALGSKANTFQHLPVALQVVVIVLLTLLLVGSATVMERAVPLIRTVLEGRWPQPGTKNLEAFLLTRLQSRVARLRETLFQEEQWLEANDPRFDDGSSSAKVNLEIAHALGRTTQIRRRLQQFPEFPEMFAPTRLGNIIRAADARPLTKYGLDTTSCWPVLWLLLEESERADISKARAALNLHAQAWAWSLLFLVWTPLAWWAAPLSLVACLVVYNSMLSAGQLYGQLLEASFDLYRDRLYTALRLPLPNDSFEERELTRMVMMYLARGTYSQRKIRFASPDTPSERPSESAV